MSPRDAKFNISEVANITFIRENRQPYDVITRTTVRTEGGGAGRGELGGEREDREQEGAEEETEENKKGRMSIRRKGNEGIAPTQGHTKMENSLC